MGVAAMKTRKSDSAKSPPARKPATRAEISAPRHRSTWEPEPLHVPVPEMPNRPREIESDLEQAHPARGVVIIQYGAEI